MERIKIYIKENKLFIKMVIVMYLLCKLVSFQGYHWSQTRGKVVEQEKEIEKLKNENKVLKNVQDEQKEIIDEIIGSLAK